MMNLRQVQLAVGSRVCNCCGLESAEKGRQRASSCDFRTKYLVRIILFVR